MQLDAHQHFWIYNTQQYPWIAPNSPLQRDWLPPDLAAAQSKSRLTGSIAVQARQTIEESHWLLQLADQHALIKGVVGWVDLQSQTVETQLAELADHPKFVGVRHLVQDEPDNDFMLRPAFLSGLSKLKCFGLTYDLLLFPKHLPTAVKVVRKFPDQPFVLDHLAKPFIKTGVLSPWKEELKELARFPNVCCKLSGLVTEANWTGWRKEDFQPYLDVAFDVFGEDRLMFGSDWPVCLLAASYTRVYDLIRDYLQQFTEGARQKVLGTNAARFYGIH
jgi:L-fuconolactonase